MDAYKDMDMHMMYILVHAHAVTCIWTWTCHAVHVICAHVHVHVVVVWREHDVRGASFYPVSGPHPRNLQPGRTPRAGRLLAWLRGEKLVAPHA